MQQWQGALQHGPGTGAAAQAAAQYKAAAEESQQAWRAEKLQLDIDAMAVNFGGATATVKPYFLGHGDTREAVVRNDSSRFSQDTAPFAQLRLANGGYAATVQPLPI